MSYKFNEGHSIQELKGYIDGTYNEHYASDKYQATDIIIDSGHGEGFCIGNIMKYAKRYGNKDGKNKKDLFLKKIQSYWPSIRKENLLPAYSGIRPLLDGRDDFVIDFLENTESLFVNVLGYASPGLTSSLALAKYIKSKISYFGI